MAAVRRGCAADADGRGACARCSRVSSAGQGPPAGPAGRAAVAAVFRAAKAVRERRSSSRAGVVDLPCRAVRGVRHQRAGRRSLVPLVFVSSAFDRTGDLFALVYLLLLGTFFLALAGLDTGLAIRRHGLEPRDDRRRAHRADRGAVDLRAGAHGGIDQPRRDRHADARAPGARRSDLATCSAFAALFVVTLAETGRLPVDNPSTHLELTMIHEAMVLEYSGPYLALVEWASSAEAVRVPVARRESVPAVGDRLVARRRSPCWSGCWRSW